MSDDTLREFVYKMKDELMLFHLLSDEEIEQILPYLEVVLYPMGTILFEEGDPGDSIMFIAHGKLEVKKQTEFKGKEIVIGKLGRGSLVGELSFVSDKEPRSASVIALEDTEVVVLQRASLDSLTEKYPAIGIKILKGLVRVLAIRLRKSVERLSLIF